MNLVAEQRQVLGSSQRRAWRLVHRVLDSFGRIDVREPPLESSGPRTTL